MCSMCCLQLVHCAVCLVRNWCTVLFVLSAAGVCSVRAPAGSMWLWSRAPTYAGALGHFLRPDDSVIHILLHQCTVRQGGRESLVLRSTQSRVTVSSKWQGRSANTRLKAHTLSGLSAHIRLKAHTVSGLSTHTRLKAYTLSGFSAHTLFKTHTLSGLSAHTRLKTHILKKILFGQLVVHGAIS